MGPAQKKRVSENIGSDGEDDFNFLVSQQSIGSEDQDFEIALAKHYAGGKHYNLSHTTDVHRSSAREEEEGERAPVPQGRIYTAGDRGIISLPNIRQAIIQTKLTANVEAAKKTETGQIAGLSRTQAACRELQETIHQIFPNE
ncbi:hypothetical protein H0H93_012414 [Arthromyces matolae]|nr:hypothetical protein H0H93_012414 [Arthromyces matolae]